MRIGAGHSERKNRFVPPERTQVGVMKNKEIGSDRSEGQQIGQLFVHLLAFMALQKLIFVLGKIAEADYYALSVLPALGKNLIGTPLGWLLIASFIILRRRAGLPWSSVTNGTWLRWFATGVAITLVLNFATQGVNLYFGREYLLDRLVLIGLAIGVCIRPVFIPAFVLVMVAYGGQFSIPIDGYDWDTHLLGIHRLKTHSLLVIFVGFVIAKDVRPIPSGSTVLLVVVLIASFYWVPGLGKLRMGWVSAATVQNSLFGSWGHGWMASLSGEDIANVTRRMRPFAIPMQVIVLIIECGAVFILVRRVAIVLLPMWVLFHIGTLALYGYCFWAWILMDLAVLVLILREPDAFRFDRKHCVLGFMLVGSSILWLSPNRLAWFNAPLANTFHVVATTEDGTVFEVNPKALGPYDYIFTMKMFGSIANEPQLSGPYGATTSKKTALASGPDLADRQRRNKKPSPESKLKGQLKDLLVRYATRWNAGQSNESYFGSLHPPSILNTTLPERDMTKEQIVSIHLERRRQILTGETVLSELAEVCFRVDVKETADRRAAP